MGTYLTHADLGVHTGTHLGSLHLGPSALPQLLMPYVYGQVNADPHSVIWLRVGGYLSATLLLFAALGLLAPGRRGLKLVLLGWGLLVFARIYGVPAARPGAWRACPRYRGFSSTATGRPRLSCR